MIDPIWINLHVIKAYHDRQINEHGGLPGLRDEELLVSAISRPENAYHYFSPKPDVAELAAAYGFGLAKIIRSMMLINARHLSQCACF